MKRIENLYDLLFAAAADLKRDDRFSHWIKRVERVDSTKRDGYAFEGPFVSRGTIEYKVKPGLYLIASPEGSRKSQWTYYRVVEMDAEGNLTWNETIQTSNAEPGWALRIREQIAARLAEIALPQPAPTEPPTPTESVLEPAPMPEVVTALVPAPATNSLPEFSSVFNLTPHVINIYAEDGVTVLHEIPPSGDVARVAETRSVVGMADDIVLTSVEYGEVKGLPVHFLNKSEPDALYIVSALVFNALGGENANVAAPGPAVRAAAEPVVYDALTTLNDEQFAALAALVKQLDPNAKVERGETGTPVVTPSTGRIIGAKGLTCSRAYVAMATLVASTKGE